MSFLGLFGNPTVVNEQPDEFAIVDDVLPEPNIGENGTLQLTEDEVGDIRLVLFSNLCRGTPIEKIERLLNIYFSQINDENRVEMITDLFVIIFEKRDCRGGEGEKLLFRQMLEHARTKYYDIVVALLHLIPEYGSWLDMWELANPSQYDFTNEIYRICSEQINKDRDAKHPTLCAKWSPSEGSEHYRRLFPSILNYFELINPGSSALQKDYRKTINPLRERANVVEQLMCANRYAEIDPSKTPSVCANKWRKAFLNISLDETKRMLDYEKGNRYPDRKDRVLARQRWQQNVKEGKVKGGQLDPMALVRAVRYTRDKDEIDLINCQWNDLVSKTRKQIEKAIEDGHEPMNNVIPMIDRSGSMYSEPEIAAVGLGLLLAEVCNPVFGNVVMTFANKPALIKVDPRLTFSERVRIIERMEEGFNTNFELAMNLVCDIIKKKNLRQHELPSICILTDAQMDQGNMFGYSKTVDEGIKTRFEQLGNEMHGTPFNRPRTIHWNLRGNTQGYPVKACENNVQAITGYSASLLDLILTGKPEPTPYETMRRKLDSERYNAVREVVKNAI